MALESRSLWLTSTKKLGDIEHFHFTKATIFYGFISFEKFLESIESGLIMYDVRIGAYKTGRNKGKTHDHGSGFRIKKEHMGLLYHKHIEVV